MTNEKPIARCKNSRCNMTFSVWASDDKTCPECEGEMQFTPNEKDQEFREENKNDWISEYFELYKKGRQNKSPIDYIDYYESRHFILKLLEADRKIQKEEVLKSIDLMIEHGYDKEWGSLKMLRAEIIQNS